MARIVRTDLLDQSSLDDVEADWIYNGLDCCVTHEVFGKSRPLMTPNAELTYQFCRAMQAPALEMMLRGTLIDMDLRNEEISKLEAKVKRLEAFRDRIALVTWKRQLNDKSPAQLKAYFYSYMNLPEQYRNDKGTRVITTNRNALEDLSKAYFYAEAICGVILKLHDLRKLISTLKSAVDPDGRMRTSYNVGATENDRWSSSKNVFGRGTNDQNITNEIRRIFISEDRRKFGNADLEQAESFVVGYVSEDEDYIAACKSGDLHTLVARMVWPELAWPGQTEEHFKANIAAYKAIAEQPFYRHFTYRDMSKRGGHLTNYYGQPWTAAQHLNVDVSLMQDFQERYLGRFTGIPRWHEEVAYKLQTDGYLITCLGFRRDFFGRRDDDATLREAIACEPQATVAQILNVILWRVWKYLPEVHVLKQGHDSFLFSYPEKREAQILKQVKELAHLPVQVRGREMLIPTEVATGWNWGKYNDDEKKGQINLGGLKTWKGEDTRKRDRPAVTALLDRRIHGVH